MANTTQDAVDGAPKPMQDEGFDSNDKEYYNKQVDGILDVKHLDGLSQEGWKLIAVAPIHQQGELHHYSYFFRKRRK